MVAIKVRGRGRNLLIFPARGIGRIFFSPDRIGPRTWKCTGGSPPETAIVVNSVAIRQRNARLRAIHFGANIFKARTRALRAERWSWLCGSRVECRPMGIFI